MSRFIDEHRGTRLELAIVDYVGWFNPSGYTKRSATGRPWSSRTTL